MILAADNLNPADAAIAGAGLKIALADALQPELMETARFLRQMG